MMADTTSETKDNRFSTNYLQVVIHGSNDNQQFKVAINTNEEEKEGDEDMTSEESECVKDEQDAIVEPNEDEQDAIVEPKEDEQDSIDEPKEDEQDAIDEPKEDEQDAIVEPKEDEQDSIDEPKKDDRGTTTIYDNIARYSVLYVATIQDDWESVELFLDLNPEAATAKITRNNETVLHIGVMTMSTSNLEKLLARVPDETMLLESMNGETPLHFAAYGGKLEAVKLLVARNPRLPNISKNPNRFPIHHGAAYNYKDVFLYLLEVTKDDTTPNPFKGEPGNQLLIWLIDSSFVESALRLVRRYPNLAVESVYNTPLLALSKRSYLFPSGTKYNFYQRFVYKCIPLDKHAMMTLERTHPKRYEKKQNCAQIFCFWLWGSWRKLFMSVWDALYRLFWNGGIMLVPEIKRIKNAKEVHHYSLELLKFLCKEVSRNINANTEDSLDPPLLQASEQGIHEVIEEILIVYPAAAYFKIAKDMNIIQHGIVNRQHTIFNLLFQMSPLRNLLLGYEKKDASNNLHMVAELPPAHRLNVVPGAALQMQRELQWYKAVESFSLPFQALKRNNNGAGIMPAALFTEQHAELVKEGEKWMRDTANSCTIAAALIATIAFAAGITVPGGYNGATGFPIFNTTGLFLTFTVSNGLSLFTSSAALIMFLSMLTARYTEADFLNSLPQRLIFGLVALFVSITSMMVTFSIILFLTYEKNERWIMGPLAALGVLPVALFVFLQFPLLLDIMSSTYGRGIFRKQGDRPLF